MYTITQSLDSGVIQIYDNFLITATGIDAAPIFYENGDEYNVIFTQLNNVVKFKQFNYNYTGKMSDRYLFAEYRISRNLTNWSQWYELPTTISEFPPLNPKNDLHFNLRITRLGSSKIGTIKLLNYELIGELDRLVINQPNVELSKNKINKIIYKPPFIYKVFKIEDIEVLFRGGTLNDFTIKYRYSQDYGRTVTDWIPFTRQNIISERITPIRFFQIEYLVELIGDTNVKIFDINLIGDFQNVTLDYQKTNLLGVREDCNCEKLNIVGDITNKNVGIQTGISKSNTVSQLPQLNSDQIQNLYKPYQLSQASELLNKLSNDSNEIFGHEVVYFLTDPDKLGIDYTFNEYQLYNYVSDSLIKVSVENNQFPDNTGAINQFDLSLFDSFEIHITKKGFKEKFGQDKRPSKGDFLWFCEINRMFLVEHAQPFRQFNNYSIYYKLMLKKYTQRANVIGVNQTIADKVKELTKNSTIDELFGLEKESDKLSVANKEQFTPLTKPDIRHHINCKITKELIENGDTIISKQHYDLSSVPFTKTESNDCVVYNNIKDFFAESNNISFLCWFKINNLLEDEQYHLCNYYDEDSKLGFKIRIQDFNIKFAINLEEYSFNINGDLDEDIWYGYVMCLDQRGRKLSQSVYKRNIDDEELGNKISSNILKLVKSETWDIIPQQMSLQNVSFRLLSCDMSITNIRLFLDIIPSNQHSKILNQTIIRDDSKFLIFADNANQKLILPNFNF